MIEQFVRPLTADEQARIAHGIRFHRLWMRRQIRHLPLGSLITCGLFWGLTLWISPEPWWVSTLVWSGVAVFVWLRSYITGRGQRRRYVEQLESALRRNSASVARVVATDVVELEESENEGPCYAFQIENNRIVFVCDAQEYPGNFPNDDFSIVDVQDAGGDVPWSFLHRQGRKLEPSRRIPAADRGTIWPAHLQVIEGRLAELEYLQVGTPDKG